GIIALPEIGQRLATKILEIIETGHLSKLEEYQTNDEVKKMDMFTKIWGAGPTQAKKWIDQGYQTLDDLRAKAHLTHNQQVGLKYYDEFLQRIPR
ncbi:unnamed protein product, partial [Didymodactylos carnosus]